MSQAEQDRTQAEQAQAVHAASRKAREARDAEDRKRSREAMKRPLRVVGRAPGERRSDGVLLMPKEKAK